MIKRQILVFIIRWVASSFGMYLCISLFGKIGPEASVFTNALMMFAVAGLIFSLVNTVVKPLVKLLALPFAIVTMGISTVIINIGMVILTIYLLPGVEMEFWGAVASSAVMSSINTLLTLII